MRNVKIVNSPYANILFPIQMALRENGKWDAFVNALMPLTAWSMFVDMNDAISGAIDPDIIKGQI